MMLRYGLRNGNLEVIMRAILARHHNHDLLGN